MSNLYIYQSSAGSGKTYKLSKEYLKLAFKYPGAFKKILAITFTNKATEEMKNRILKFLVDLSDERNEDLKKQLMEEGLKGDIREQAKVTLNAILHNYSDFSVSTIDSFFNRVLRSFSKELKLQIGYKVELDQKKVLREIADLLFRDLRKDAELRKYLEDFIMTKISEDKGWNIERDIMKLAEEIFRERYWEKKLLIAESGSNDDISDNRKKINLLFEDINGIIRSFEEHLRQIGDEAEEIMKKYRLEVDDFTNKKTGVGGFLLYKIRDKKDYELKTLVLRAYENAESWYTKESKKKEIIGRALDDGLYGLLKKAVDYIREDSVRYYSAKTLKNTLFTLGIFEDLISKLNEYRRKNRILLQSDVNNILRGLISTENSPFIYEKIGSNFKNLLIDEFQDTSTFQWNNLLPLIINALSEKNKALIVGDVKQSVYRWRSGNMNLLLSQVYSDLSGFGELMKTEYLKINRRSRKVIVDFNNVFFEKAIDEISAGIDDEKYITLLRKAYSEENLLQISEKDGGYISVNFFETDDELTSQEKSERMVFEIIKSVVQDGYSLSDILVLVRRNSEMRKISNLLANAGYNIVSAESLLVSSSPKVRIIIDLIKYICDNRAVIPQVDALYNYNEFILPGNSDLTKTFEEYSGEFIERLPKELFKENEPPKIKSVLNDLNVYEVCENLIQIFGFDNSPDPYLIKFLDVVLEYSTENSSDLNSFLDWWEEKKGEYTIDSIGGTDAVSIMTIHKAKGLQSKIVIIPYANWQVNIDGKKDLIWVSTDEPPFNKSSAYLVKATSILKDTLFKNDYDYEFAQTRLDNLNLMYVAFTRAEDRLYVMVPEKKGMKNVGELIKNTIGEFNNDDGTFYESGVKDKLSGNECGENLGTEMLKNFLSATWYKKTIIKPKHEKIREFVDKDFALKTNWGIIIHKILSYIRVTEDIDKAVNKVCLEGIISEKQKPKIKERLMDMFKNPDIRDWFSNDWKIKSENEILLKDGSVLRPDRVIIKGKKAVVVDYKTGMENESHKKQILQYGETLKLMGYEELRMYLLYINDDDTTNLKIVEVKN